MEHPLTLDQQTVFDIVENTDDNILLIGEPGVGKSVLVRALREFGQKKYVVGAPTALAAINADGKTLHSIFGIPVSDGIMTPDFNKYTNNPNVRNYIFHTLKHLIIDEISMVSAPMLDYIDRLLRDVKQVDAPFGGIQIIAVGDFFQLPPVTRGSDRRDMRACGWKSEFAFDAFAMQNFKLLALTEVLRQRGDNAFINIIRDARTGDIGAPALKSLNTRVEACEGIRIRLASKNDIADAINMKELRAIKSDAVEFSAQSFGHWDKFPHDTILTLKVGAQVIIKKNGADRPPKLTGKFDSKVVNGSLGIITDIQQASDETPACVRVELRDGTIVPIYIARWERKEKEKIGDKWSEKLIASFEQMPIQLAWAISMHKSQGQSFDAVHIDPNKIFAAGQLYVAISRARSLAGLSLESKVNSNMFKVNERVLEFNEQVQRESSTNKKQHKKKVA